MKIDAKKSLGQNFLKSRKAINTMIEAPGITSDDIVVEIGPGKGALTIALLETGATVIAFELDPRMIEFLTEKFTKEIQSQKLILIHKDILDVDIKKYTKNNPYKVVANIPYYITNRIIRTFLTSEFKPTTMCLLVQKEVAERIVSRDGKESVLSLSVKFFGTPRYITKVARHYFSPIPKVDSAIILISDIFQSSNSEIPENEFFKIIKTAFKQKRKQAIKNLSELHSKQYWEHIFITLGLRITSRAEAISYKQWIMIVDHHIHNTASGSE